MKIKIQREAEARVTIQARVTPELDKRLRLRAKERGLNITEAIVTAITIWAGEDNKKQAA